MANLIGGRELVYFERQGEFPHLMFRQRNRNTSFSGFSPETSNFAVAVTKDGICLNGDCGTNPTAVEMHEVALIMRECVQAWQALAPEDDQR